MTPEQAARWVRDQAESLGWSQIPGLASVDPATVRDAMLAHVDAQNDHNPARLERRERELQRLGWRMPPERAEFVARKAAADEARAAFRKGLAETNRRALEVLQRGLGRGTLCVTCLDKDNAALAARIGGPA